MKDIHQIKRRVKDEGYRYGNSIPKLAVGEENSTMQVTPIELPQFQKLPGITAIYEAVFGLANVTQRVKKLVAAHNMQIDATNENLEYPFIGGNKTFVVSYKSAFGDLRLQLGKEGDRMMIDNATFPSATTVSQSFSTYTTNYTYAPVYNTSYAYGNYSTWM